MADKEKPSEKALGHDPFEDLDVTAWQELAAETGRPGPPPEWTRLEDLVSQIDQEMEQATGPDLGFGQFAGAAPAAGPAAEEQHVLFTLADTQYAVPISNVVEIGRPLEVTPVPNVPSWVLGVANLRGEVVSMVDLRSFLGLEPLERDATARMVVAQARTDAMTAGLLVDWVGGIRQLAVSEIVPPAAPLEGPVATFLRGVCESDGHLLVVLDLEGLLLSREMRQFEPA
jgi:purine-binding chemotaxis protein CheW